MDPYRVLGVPPTASAAEIRDAYRRRAKLSHPDAGGTAADFDVLTLAYDTLTDPGRRFAHDRATARRDAAAAASVRENEIFEELTRPAWRQRARHPSRVGNLAVSVVGGAAIIGAAIVLRFAGNSRPGPPTPVSCAAVRFVSATFVLVRTADGSSDEIHPRVTLHNTGSAVSGATVSFAVSVQVSGAGPARTLGFGARDAAIWARAGRTAVTDLTGDTGPAVAARDAPVRVVIARATGATVRVAATSLPATGCAIPLTAT